MEEIVEVTESKLAAAIKTWVEDAANNPEKFGEWFGCGEEEADEESARLAAKYVLDIIKGM